MLNLSKAFPQALKERINKTLISTLKANKKLGQHFLHDQQICDRIATSCGSLNDSVVLEIGPGMGHLTQSILALNANIEMFVIEKDIRFIPILQEIGNFYQKSKLNIIQSDALTYNFQSLITQYSHKKIYIIANLPYNIGTELLFRWLDKGFLENITNISLLLQKEVVNKIIATHNSKAYGWLSILSQLLCDVDLLFDVQPTAFTPEPKIISSVIRLKPHILPYEYNIKKLKLLCKALFIHRRKSINTIIKNNPNLQYLLPAIESLNLNLKMRPEEIDIQTFCKISTL